MSSYSEGQVHQLANRLEESGWPADDLTRLGQFKNLSGIREVLHGRAEIVVVKNIVDLDAKPFEPAGWQVKEHIKGGQFVFDPAKVKLHYSPGQKNGMVIGGHKLREELKRQPVFNANLLDFYLANPHLIPEDWKGKYVFFWGTIYRADGGLSVRCLYWDGRQWDWYYYWLGHDWDSCSPAAVSAS